MTSRPIDILMVEDDVDDIELTRIMLTQARVLNELHVVRDGQEALRYLRRQGCHQDAPRPDLVLLDWHLPKLSGREVLDALRRDPVLKDLNVIVLTPDQSVITGDPSLPILNRMAKPVDFEQLLQVIRSSKDLWLNVVIQS